MKKLFFSITMCLILVAFSCKKDDDGVSAVNCVAELQKIDILADALQDNFTEQKCQELKAAVKEYRKANCPITEELLDSEGIDIENIDCSSFANCLRLLDELEAMDSVYSTMPSQENCLNYKKIAAEYVVGECPNFEMFQKLEEIDCSNL